MPPLTIHPSPRFQSEDMAGSMKEAFQRLQASGRMEGLPRHLQEALARVDADPHELSLGGRLNKDLDFADAGATVTRESASFGGAVLDVTRVRGQNATTGKEWEVGRATGSAEVQWSSRNAPRKWSVAMERATVNREHGGKKG